MAEAHPDVAVVFGGPSPEHDVSVLTGLQAARALGARALYWTKTAEWYEVDPDLEASAFLSGVPRGAARVQLLLESGYSAEGGRFGRPRPLGVEVAVVCCHGGPGEDGTLQAALDLAGVRYTGPSVAGAGLGMDKLAFAAVVSAAGLTALPRVLLASTTTSVGFEGPYIVKPRFGGSSIGISVVEDLSTATSLLTSTRHLRAGAVVEPYRSDLFDLQIAVRSWPQLSLSSIERPLRTPRAGGAAGEPEILGYADKYVGGEGMASARLVSFPAKIDDALEVTVRDVATQVGHLSAVRGVSHVDFLSDGRELYVNEVNTIPGSLARYLWVDPAVAFTELLSDMIDEAKARPSHYYSVDGADGTVLQGAASIAAKLA